MSGNSWSDFDIDSDHGADTGMFKLYFYHCYTNYAGNSKSCGQFCIKIFFSGVGCLTNKKYLILVLLQITIWTRDVLFWWKFYHCRICTIIRNFTSKSVNNKYNAYRVISCPDGCLHCNKCWSGRFCFSVSLSRLALLCRKTVADTAEEEGPFLPRPAPTAPYPYGSPAVYGPPTQENVP